jgi:hypothetical protein
MTFSPADLTTAVQEAAFAAVSAVFPNGPSVFTVVPENPGNFFVVVGSTIDSEDISGTVGAQLERLTLEIEYIYQGTQRSDLTAAMATARGALDQVRLVYAGARFDVMKWRSSSVASAQSDGTTHAGIQSYQVIAQPS